MGKFIVPPVLNVIGWGVSLVIDWALRSITDDTLWVATVVMGLTVIAPAVTWVI